jgi:hypothetical protein
MNIKMSSVGSKKVPGTCFVVFARVLGGEAATLTILMLSVAGKDIFKLDKIVFPINQEHALGLRRHLHAGKAHPVFDSMGDDGMMYLESLSEYVKTNIKRRKGHHFGPDQWSWSGARVILRDS